MPKGHGQQSSDREMSILYTSNILDIISNYGNILRSPIDIIIQITSQINVVGREIRRQGWTFYFSCCVPFFFQPEALVMCACSSNLTITLNLGVTPPAGSNVSTNGSATYLNGLGSVTGHCLRALSGKMALGQGYLSYVSCQYHSNNAPDDVLY